VAADAKLTHPAEVNLTHPGQADGLLAVDVDPGASSGSQSPAPARAVSEIDRQGAWLFAQYRAALPA
ncbi:MAG: hypothetical protein MUF08_11860, partial [Burkholderiaceae bacterium]|nr:hypothetical protein [Burkholderiaceae bacterium]